jgi:hypothetical protein
LTGGRRESAQERAYRLESVPIGWSEEGPQQVGRRSMVVTAPCPKAIQPSGA